MCQRISGFYLPLDYLASPFKNRSPMMRRLLTFSLISIATQAIAQNASNSGELHGNFQFDGYSYFRDEGLDPSGEDYPEEQFLGQGFANLIYTRGNITAGLRYENYQNPILGYPPGFVGEGITYRFLQFKKDRLDVTVGNFYEQFGSGMIYRTYEERLLGLDNAMDGVRLIYEPVDGVRLKGILGKQRVYFEKGEGIVRGIDGEFNLNELLNALEDSPHRWTFGSSFVSKYEADKDPQFNLPENVGSYGMRLNYGFKGFGLQGEYVHKINDPSADNGYIYKPGNGLMLTTTFARKGFGFVGAYKLIDNMSYRSERNAGQFELFMNFLPPTTKIHTYALPALYPYATQINGETGLQFEVTFKLARGSFLGGKRGGKLALNYSDAYSLSKDPVATSDSTQEFRVEGTDGYETNYFRFGPHLYFRDVNVAYSRSASKNFKYTLSYFNFVYNQGVLGSATNSGGITDEVLDLDESKADYAFVHVGVFEGLWKIKPKHSLRFELQSLHTRQDRGDMAMMLLEYSISPNWFFAAQNIYNYGHPDADQRLHYPLVSAGYIQGTTRFQLTFGRQQRGIFCVGGICRVVPASTSIGLSVTSNF